MRHRVQKHRRASLLRRSAEPRQYRLQRDRPGVEIVNWVIFATAFALGSVVGSFLNVVIFRAPARWGFEDAEYDRGGLALPRSYCPACRTQISPRDLIPLVSFAALGGRCRACRTRIPIRYPVIEALGGAVLVAALAAFGLSAEAALATLFGWMLLALAAIDFRTGFLPDRLTLPLIGGGLAANAAGLFATPFDAAIGALAGYLSFRLIGEAFLLLRKKEGLGQGDAKLLAALGAWTGWQALPAIVFLGAAATLFVVLIAMFSASNKAEGNPEIPFGPGLCAAGFAALLLADVLFSPIGL